MNQLSGDGVAGEDKTDLPIIFLTSLTILIAADIYVRMEYHEKGFQCRHHHLR